MALGIMVLNGFDDVKDRADRMDEEMNREADLDVVRSGTPMGMPPKPTPPPNTAASYTDSSTVNSTPPQASPPPLQINAPPIAGGMISASPTVIPPPSTPASLAAPVKKPSLFAQYGKYLPYAAGGFVALVIGRKLLGGGSRRSSRSRR